MTADTVTAICALIVAAVAVGVSVWHGIMTRKHNRLSVKPFLEITLECVDETPIYIAVRSKGIGPAVLKSISLCVNKKQVHDGSRNGIDDTVKALGLGNHKYEATAVVGPNHLAPGEHWELIRFPGTENDGIQHANVLAALTQLEVAIEYTSIYGEEFTVWTGFADMEA